MCNEFLMLTQKECIGESCLVFIWYMAILLPKKVKNVSYIPVISDRYL